ncbi:MAG: ATP-binding protein [Kofleriaceae bacterium]|nr:ATP-binding protein [Kofleriaceae bacterium]
MVTVADRSSQLDALCDWLRDALRARLDALRGASSEQPRAELDALLDLARADEASAPPIPASLAALSDRFDLRRDERAVLAVLLAAALAPELGRSLGLLCDPLGRDVVTLEAVASLLGFPRTYRLTAEDGVARWSLIVRTAPALSLDPTIEARLAGRTCRDPILVETIALIPARAPLPGWPVDELAEQVRRSVAAGARSVRLWLRGPDGSGRRTLFAAVARALDLTPAVVAPEPAAPTVRAALRLARLEDLALAWTDRVRLPPDLSMPAVQAWLDAEPPPPLLGVADIMVRMPVADRPAKEAAWRTLVPAFSTWPDADRVRLLDGWSARPGQLAALALSGAANPDDAIARLRVDATQRLEGHCEVLETPFEWDDLVLPERVVTSLRELAQEARVLPRLWSEPSIGRLFPQGRSIAALFCGPPGTGKTMAAQVVTRELGLPLFRVDLSRIVSKYIGETSQNLSRILGAVRHTDAVVLFDEADALFGKRTEVHDAHDRYANTETDYLLQALDAWPGLAILATNQRGNIDAAFTRRMRLILDFPRAEAAERLRIWTRLGTTFLPERLRELAPVIGRAASEIELSGAQIKGALLTACAAATYAGAAVTADHLVRGIERELEKEGLGLAPRDRALLLGRA